MLKPVLLSGGVGSRLWPVSRRAYPKQFLPLAGSDSMLVDTLRRVAPLAGGQPMVLCNEEHRFIVAEQLRLAGAGAGEIIVEPVGRNTAPAVAIAALYALRDDAEALLLVLPADHIVRDRQSFLGSVRRALPLAESGRLVTFGVRPARAETGYGYIRRGASLGESGAELGSFVEKPERASAERYIASGDYLWNSGMYLLRARVYLDELGALAPAMLESCAAALAGASQDLDFMRLDADAFAACPEGSIDRAVMEKTDRGAVVGLDCGWSDVGAWSELWEAGERDAAGNVVQGDVLLDQVSDSLLRSESRLLAATGVSDVVVVETADAVLVADRRRVQDVRRLVAALKARRRSEAELHRRAYRPWGSYESLIVSERFQVKRIVVNPGQRLSLQRHRHRAEHWIVVAGAGEVTCEDRVFALGEDQSTYIPLGHKHRLANPGPAPLEVIEVQSGSYLGEDDIERFDDEYGRGG